jgi:hypothetical protein
MIIHTLVFSFDPAMTRQDRDRFFEEMQHIVEESGLATGFDHRDHVPFPPMDEHAPVFAASALAQIAFPDINAVGALGIATPLQQFIERWQARYPYKVVWVNTEPLPYDTIAS